MTAPNNALSIVPAGTFAVTTLEPSDVVEGLREAGVTPFQLLRAKVGAGGMPAFQLDAASGTKVVDHIDCVIALVRGGQRAWWRNELGDGGGNAPPDCSSTDGMTGHGIISLDPAPGEKPSTRKCSDCPWGQFESKRAKPGKTSRGKDCKESSELYFFETRSRLPKLLVAPATSLKGLRKYAMRLADEGFGYQGVVTRLTLSRAKNADGIDYSVIEANMVGVLPPEEASRMQGLCARLREWVVSVNARPTASEFVEHETKSSTASASAPRAEAEEDPNAFADADPLS